MAIYNNRIDNNHLFVYKVGNLCFIYGLFRIIEASPWAEMALATGAPSPAWNTIAPVYGVNITSHDDVTLHINNVGSLVVKTVMTQYTWVSVFGMYRSD